VAAAGAATPAAAPAAAAAVTGQQFIADPAVAQTASTVRRAPTIPKFNFFSKATLRPL
jgi:hypothetical protein